MTTNDELIPNVVVSIERGPAGSWHVVTRYGGPFSHSNVVVFPAGHEAEARALARRESPGIGQEPECKYGPEPERSGVDVAIEHANRRPLADRDAEDAREDEAWLTAHRGPQPPTCVHHGPLDEDVPAIGCPSGPVREWLVDLLGLDEDES